MDHLLQVLEICFGLPAGNYIIIATNTATGCKDTMAGSVTVTVNPIPTAYTVSTLGNGQYCSSAPGVTIELSGSEVGVNYELFVNGVTTGIISPGTGSAIDFANQPAGTLYYCCHKYHNRLYKYNEWKCHYYC